MYRNSYVYLAEGVDIDAELNLPTPETTEQADSKEAPSDVTLQVQIANNDNSSISRKISTEAIPAEATDENGRPTEPVNKPQTPDIEVKPKPVVAPKPAGIKTSDLTHRDPGKHWCGVTSKWLNSIHELLHHLHSDEYQAKLSNKDKPWKRRLEMFHTKLKALGIRIIRKFFAIVFIAIRFFVNFHDPKYQNVMK